MIRPPPEVATTPEPSNPPSSSQESVKHASASETPSSSSGSSGSQESSGSGEGSPSQGAKAKLSSIKHVFVVMLSDEPYATAFGPASPAHYLAGTLEKQGQ